MAAPIGVGDWVECVSDRRSDGLLCSRLRVGAIYCVSATGFIPAGFRDEGAPFIAVAELPPKPGKFGFHADHFRPIYRPKADFIESLKAPPKVAPVAPTEPTRTPEFVGALNLYDGER